MVSLESSQGLLIEIAMLIGVVLAVPTPEQLVRIDRSDQIRIGRQDRVCVSAQVDQAVMASARRAGEELDDFANNRFANDTAAAIDKRLEMNGLPGQISGSFFPPQVVVDSSPAAHAICQKVHDTIIVKIHVNNLSENGGYQIELTVVQRRRTLIATLSRQQYINMPMAERALIPLDANSTHDGRNYWDIAHDIYKVRVRFLEKVFGNRK